MKLNLYQKNDLLASVEKNTEGSTKITIDGITPNTDYPEGTYQVSWSNDTGESNKVNVPSFRTLKILLESLDLTATDTEITVGETTQLNVTFNPTDATDKDVTYSVDNSDIATVSTSGIVTAQAPGQATVTAKVGDVSTTTQITVKEAIPEEPTDVSVEPGTDSTDVTV